MGFSVLAVALALQAASPVAAPAATGLIPATAPAAAPAPTSAPLRADDRGRPVISIWINDQGPYDFVVDTAAQRTFVMPRLIDRLGLSPIPGAQQIQGASGQSQVSLYQLNSLRSDAFAAATPTVLALPNPSITEAWGVVGMSGFLNHRLEFDNEAGRFGLDVSRPTPAGWASLPFRTVARSFAVVEVELDGVRMQAVIDSGARVTILNARAREALGYVADDARLTPAETIGGATGGATPAQGLRLGSLGLGATRIEGVAALTADLPVFGPLGLMDTPALILGSDVLNRLPAYAVDYPAQQFQIRAGRITTAPRGPATT